MEHAPVRHGLWRPVHGGGLPVLSSRKGLAGRGAVNGDVFVVGSIGFVVAVVSIFIFFPILRCSPSGLQAEDGSYSLSLFLGEIRSTTRSGVLACLTGGTRCGVAWNSLFLAVMVGVFQRLLGLVFALVVTRTRFPLRQTAEEHDHAADHHAALRDRPCHHPAVRSFRHRDHDALRTGLGTQPTRWIYGFNGVFIAQLLAFTPIAFLVLIGVVEGVSPSMEEAAQTLRASHVAHLLDRVACR